MSCKMANEFNRAKDTNDKQSLTQLELLEALLAADEPNGVSNNQESLESDPSFALYPWDPTDPESEAYFEEQEQHFLLEDWTEEEINDRSTAFFSQLDQIWLQTNLQQKFANHIPPGLLVAIAQKAYQAISAQRSMVDQLVHCVQDLLPNWGEDDLLVLARPFAYNMRSADAVGGKSLLSDANQDWADLTEIEQARTSLAIACYAIAEIQNSQ